MKNKAKFVIVTLALWCLPQYWVFGQKTMDVDYLTYLHEKYSLQNKHSNKFARNKINYDCKRKYNIPFDSIRFLRPFNSDSILIQRPLDICSFDNKTITVGKMSQEATKEFVGILYNYGYKKEDMQHVGYSISSRCRTAPDVFLKFYKDGVENSLLIFFEDGNVFFEDTFETSIVWGCFCNESSTLLKDFFLKHLGFRLNRFYGCESYISLSYNEIYCARSNIHDLRYYRFENIDSVLVKYIPDYSEARMNVIRKEKSDVGIREVRLNFDEIKDFKNEINNKKVFVEGEYVASKEAICVDIYDKYNHMLLCINKNNSFFLVHNHKIFKGRVSKKLAKYFDRLSKSD